MLEEVTILEKFGDKLIRISWCMKSLNNMDGMKIIRWKSQMRYFQLMLQSICDARDIECDYDPDSDDEDGLECDVYDFD